MRLLKAFLIGCALLTAGTANAERVFDIEVVTKRSTSGVRESWFNEGVLILRDDRTFVIEWVWSEGVDEGIWLQEKNNLQLFYAGGIPFSEAIARDEEEASVFAGVPVRLTSRKFHEVSSRFDMAGNLKIRFKTIKTFRPGLRGSGPLKVILSRRYIGILR
jgi:hypothetical protein